MNKRNQYISAEDVDKLRTNEFNDATTKYIDIDDAIIDETPVENNSDEDLEKKHKRKKIIFIVLGIIILLILIFLFIKGCVLGNGKLTSVTINSPSIIYVSETTDFSVEAVGKRNLKNTSYTFSLSDNDIVSLEKKALSGTKVTNSFISLDTGKFLLSVNATLGTKKVNQTKEIAICKYLTEDSFATEDLTAIVGKQTSLAIDLGIASECYKKLNIELGNNELLRIEDKQYLFGLKEGETTIIFKYNDKEVTKKVTIVDENKLVNPTSLSLNKSSTIIYVGYKEQLKAILLPENTTNKTLNWISSNSAIVTVTNAGLLKGISKGTATVTVTSEDKTLKAEVKVTVKEQVVTESKDTTIPKLTKVTIYSNNSNSSYAKLGDTITLEVISSEILRIKPSISIYDKPLFVTCNDDSNITKCYVTLKVDDSLKGLASITIKGYKDMSLNTGDIVTKTTDGSTVFIDTIAPKCEATLVTQGISQSIVKFSWSDIESGLSKVITPNKDIYNYLKDKENHEQNYTLNTTLTGKNYSMTVTDMANNTRVCTATVTGLDDKAPIITVTAASGIDKATINVTITDNIGVVAYALTESTATPTAWTNIASTKMMTATYTKGAGTYYIHAVDIRGNTSYNAISLKATSNNLCPCTNWEDCNCEITTTREWIPDYVCKKSDNPLTGGGCCGQTTAECLAKGYSHEDCDDCIPVCPDQEANNQEKTIPNYLILFKDINYSIYKLASTCPSSCTNGCNDNGYWSNSTETICDRCCTNRSSCYIVPNYDK